MSGQIVNANPTVISHADLPSRESRDRGSLSAAALTAASNPMARYLGGIMWELEQSNVGADIGSAGGLSSVAPLPSKAGTTFGHARSSAGLDRRDPFTLFSAARFENMLAGNGSDESDRSSDGADRSGRLDSDTGSMTSVEDAREDIDEQEIYGAFFTMIITREKHANEGITSSYTDLIAPISDPEHPLSLGSLAIVNLEDIHIHKADSCGSNEPGRRPSSTPRSAISSVMVEITPTINHCSLATVIGLGVRVRLEQALPPRFRVDVHVKPGTHSTAEAVTKQLTDKERVAAALENETLMRVIRKMLATCK